jgi:hypothetical protein
MGYTSSIQDTEAIVNFLAHNSVDTFAVVCFGPGSGDDNLFYVGIEDTLAEINFLARSEYDVLANVVFIPFSTFDFDTSVNFTYLSGIFDFVASVNFTNNFSIDANVIFVQSDEFNLDANVTMYQLFDFPANIVFLSPNTLDIFATVFLGGFHYDINAMVTFDVSQIQDFAASIQIVQVDVQKNINNFISTEDFLSSMFIMGTVNFDILASVNFQVPPFDYDLLASVVFTQFGVSNFPSFISITNSVLGGGNVTVIVQPMANSSELSMLDDKTVPNSIGIGSTITPLQTTPSISSNNIATTSDATGYFEIANLAPGSYQIIPMFSGIDFNPPAFNVVITDSNVTLNFDSSGDLINVLQTQSNLPQTDGICPLNLSSGSPGTYSIEGYIKLSPPTIIPYTEILTIITDETIANNYRNTLPFSL